MDTNLIEKLLVSSSADSSVDTSTKTYEEDERDVDGDPFELADGEVLLLVQ